MSNINLLSNEVWVDRDLSDLTTATIRRSFSAEDELKAARLTRKINPSQEDLAYIAAVDAAIANAISVCNLVRRDNELLKEVIAFEAGCSYISEAGMELYNLRKLNVEHINDSH